MIAKSKSYHEKKHLKRAQKRSAKRAAAKAAHRTQPTPRSQRIPASKTPSIFEVFASSATKFNARLARAA